MKIILHWMEVVFTLILIIDIYNYFNSKNYIISSEGSILFGIVCVGGIWLLRFLRKDSEKQNEQT